MKCVGDEKAVYYQAAKPNFYLFTDYLCNAYLPLWFRHKHIVSWPSVHETAAAIPCHGVAASHLPKIIEKKNACLRDLEEPQMLQTRCIFTIPKPYFELDLHVLCLHSLEICDRADGYVSKQLE